MDTNTAPTSRRSNFDLDADEPTPPPWSEDLDAPCTCAHLRHRHADGSGACSGRWKDLDGEYRAGVTDVDPDEPCLCERFELADDDEADVEA